MVEGEHKGRAMEVLEPVWDKMNEACRSNLDFRAVCSGYVDFVHATQGIVSSLEEKYETFVKQNKDRLDTPDFCLFFEKIQIKSCSEAIAECVGSVMVIAQGKFKHCQPHNFNKEVYLAFNLPPLHILKKKMIPSVVEEMMQRVSFFSDNKLTPFKSYQATLKYGPNLSSSLGNFRKKEEISSRLPISRFI